MKISQIEKADPYDRPTVDVEIDDMTAVVKIGYRLHHPPTMFDPLWGPATASEGYESVAEIYFDVNDAEKVYLQLRDIFNPDIRSDNINLDMVKNPGAAAKARFDYLDMYVNAAIIARLSRDDPSIKESDMNKFLEIRNTLRDNVRKMMTETVDNGKTLG